MQPGSWKPAAVSAEHQHVSTGSFPRPGSCCCFVSEQLLNHIISAEGRGLFSSLHLQTVGDVLINKDVSRLFRSLPVTWRSSAVFHRICSRKPRIRKEGR